MLYDVNMKSGRDLQRKITRMTEEGKDPNAPVPSTSYRGKAAVYDARASDFGVPDNSSSSGIRARESMTSTVDESFMLLAQQVNTMFFTVLFLVSHSLSLER